MAVEQAALEWADHPFEGGVKCQSPGCPNYFKRAGNRHRYCKAPTCTYRRGMPHEAELREPQGAAEEMLRRLQGEDDGEVGPAQLAARRKAVGEAIRANDVHAVQGALIDEAAACVSWADRLGHQPTRVASRPVPGASALAEAMTREQRPTAATGLVAVVLASHQRTVRIAEHRMDALWKMLAAKDELDSARRGVEQMAGGPQEEDAQTVYRDKLRAFQDAESGLEAVESAWRERLVTLGDLAEGAKAARAVAA